MISKLPITLLNAVNIVGLAAVLSCSETETDECTQTCEKLILCFDLPSSSEDQCSADCEAGQLSCAIDCVDLTCDDFEACLYACEVVDND